MVEEKVDNDQESEITKLEENAVKEVDVEQKVEKTEEAKENEEAVAPEEKTSTEEVTPELLKRIKNQIEFYFGDVNMQRDKFLINQVKLDEGWVPLSLMLNFKMLASMSTDIQVILKALEDSELMEVSEDKKKIRRSPNHPLPLYNEEYKKAQEEKSVYIKGFPQEGTTVTKLKEFLEPYGPVEHIFMRRYKDKNDKYLFKGSIFVQFSTLDAAKSFMELESVKYDATELIRKWLKDYTVEKAKEKEEIRAKRDKKKNKEPKSDEKEEKDCENEKEFNLPTGAVFYITDLPSNIQVEDIKESLTNLNASVAFIEIKGNGAWVRLHKQDSAKTFVENLENSSFTLKENQVTCRVLEGEEEKTYLEKVKQEMFLRNQKVKNQRKRGFGKRGRNQSSRNEPPNKKAKQ